MDFDPNIISYRDLSKIYWESHNPCYREGMRQYMSIVFYHDEEQKRISEEFRDSYERRYGRVYTEIIPYTRLYLAENYHQKYYLQLVKELREEFMEMYPNMRDFINSTAAARVNGYVRGYSSKKRLMNEIDLLGLSDRGKKALMDIVSGYGK